MADLYLESLINSLQHTKSRLKFIDPIPAKPVEKSVDKKPRPRKEYTKKLKLINIVFPEKEVSFKIRFLNKEKRKEYQKQQRNQPLARLKRQIKAFTNNIPLFTAEDVIKKFGPNPVCYITGKPLTYENCSLDHIIAKSRGGSNSLDNLGLVIPFINLMKGISTPEEFIRDCRKITECQNDKYQDYSI